MINISTQKEDIMRAYSIFAGLFKDRTTSEVAAIQREWDKLREAALTPSHKAEIDAIFSRQS